MSGTLPNELGPDQVKGLSGVSRETLARLSAYVELLKEWNPKVNLVSQASLRQVWRRHIWDSAQLAPLIREGAESLVDLGSGAGFPGLVLAIMLRDRSMRFVLYESILKKARFLEEVAGRTGTQVEVRASRIEAAKPEPFDVVTARACAPLSRLLSYAVGFQGRNTQYLFLKGRSVEAELFEAHKTWRMSVRQIPSRSDPSGMILDIRELAHAIG